MPSRRRRERSFRTRAEAQDWAADYRALHGRSVTISRPRKRAYTRQGRTWTRWVVGVEQRAGSGRPAGRAPLLADHLRAWLERGAGRWQPKTASNYAKLCRGYLAPMLGHLRIDEITVDDVDTLLASIQSQHQAIAVRSALSSALAMAAKQRLLPHNVAKLADPPRRPERRSGPLTPTQARRFLEVAEQHRLSALFVVTTALALRQSEVVGLQWQDVDLEASELHIARKVYRAGGAYHVGEPKSRSSKRTVPFPEEIGWRLVAQRERTAEERSHAGERWADLGLVFPNTTGGYLYGPYVTRAMQQLQERAGVPRTRFHDLRHTGASVLSALGVEMRVIQEVLGHADYQLTANTYVHPDDEQLRDAARKMGAFLRGPGSNGGTVDGDADSMAS